jgi:hypothetical protein
LEAAPWLQRKFRNRGSSWFHRLSRLAQYQARRSFAAQGYFGSIHAIDARFATGGAAGGHDDMAGEEAKFHEAAGDVIGEIEAIQCAGFALLELGESSGLVATHLQDGVMIWHVVLPYS